MVKAAPQTPLAKHMAENGISVADLAETADVSNQGARLWPLGLRKPRPENVEALHRALGIPREVLRPDLYPHLSAGV